MLENLQQNFVENPYRMKQIFFDILFKYGSSCAVNIPRLREEFITLCCIGFWTTSKEIEFIIPYI